MPDEWLTWTIKTHGKVKDSAQADHLFALLFDYFKEVLATMKQNQSLLPTYITDAGLRTNSKMHDFFKGLLFAHQACEKTWQQAWNEMQKNAPDKMTEQAKQLKHCLLMFTTFANPTKAIENQSPEKRDDFALKLTQVAKSLPEAFALYLRLSGNLVAYLPAQFESYAESKN